MLSETLPYVPHSATSKAAAGSLKGKAQVIREYVLHTIERNPDGLTCDEVEVITGLTHQTASARIVELREAGKLVATSMKRPTRSGRNAVVYKAA